MDTQTHAQVIAALHRFMAAFSLRHLGRWDERLEGLGMLDIGLIHHVANSPGITVGAVRKILDIPNSTLSSAVNRLGRRGLLLRVINAQDRRSYSLVLTEAGQQAEEAHRALDKHFADLCIRALPDAEQRRQFLDALRRVAAEADQ